MVTTDRTPAHLADMLGFVVELRSLAADLQEQDFVANRVLCLAVEKLFINVGEAAVRVGEQRRAAMPHVTWRQVIGLRNILAHGYEQVAHEVLYRTITTDLAGLEARLRQAIADLPRP